MRPSFRIGRFSNPRGGLWLLAGLGLFALIPLKALAIDLGLKTESTASSNAGGTASVEVSNLPIQTAKRVVNREEVEIQYVRVVGSDSYVLEVAKEISLTFNETYASQVLDVRDWREAVFYVIPDRDLSGQKPEPVYEMDANFSVLADTINKFQKFGETDTELIQYGWKDFGSMKIDSRKEEPVSSFVRLTTGPTSERVLATRIYGPFVRVYLKNLTPDTKVRYKILAYLSR